MTSTGLKKTMERKTIHKGNSDLTNGGIHDE